MRKSVVFLIPAALAMALAGCASVETAFAVPPDCQRTTAPSPATSPGPVRSGRVMSDDCMKRINDSMSTEAPR